METYPNISHNFLDKGVGRTNTNDTAAWTSVTVVGRPRFSSDASVIHVRKTPRKCGNASKLGFWAGMRHATREGNIMAHCVTE